MDIEALCRSLGVEHVRVINPLNLEETISCLKEELEFDALEDEDEQVRQAAQEALKSL